jgi:predicted nucleotidyltransferase
MASKSTMRLHWGKFRDQRGLVSRSTLRRMVQHIVECFHPDKIILFGSYAYGRPAPESDVDLFVVMKARNEIDQSLRIEEMLDPPFALDVIVRTPRNLHWRLAEGDWFLREVVSQGKVLYEKADAGMGPQGRGRPGRGKKDLQSKAAATR